MVIAEAYNDDGSFGDVRVVNIVHDWYIVKECFDKIEEAIENLDTDNLQPDAWYRFKMLPRSEDDGSGTFRTDWYEIVSTEMVSD